MVPRKASIHSRLHWILFLYILNILQILCDAFALESHALKDCSINTTDRQPYARFGKETPLPIERVTLLHKRISC